MKVRRGLFVPLLLPPLGFLLFGATGRDDTHITFWSAHALASLGGFLNVNGQRVEQSSTLLFTLLLALVEKLTGANLPTTAALLSIAFGVGAVFLTGRVARELRADLEVPAMVLAALSPPLLYWSMSGMETTLHACLLLGVALQAMRLGGAEDDARRALRRLCLLLPLFVMVRPEAMFTGAASLCAVGVLLLLYGPSARPVQKALGRALLVVAVTAAILMVCRRLYFGILFPQPVIAKARPVGVHSVLAGVHYLYGELQVSGIALVLAFAVLSLAGRARHLRKTRPRTLDPVALRYVVLASFLAAHLAFVVAVGGDWMEFSRFLVAPLPLAIVLAAEWVWTARFRPAPYCAFVAISAMGLVFSALGASSKGLATGAPVWRRHPPPAPAGISWFEAANRVHADDLRVLPEIERVVEAGLAREHRPLVVYSGQAGMVVFHLAKRFYKDIVFVDVRGLSTRHVTECAPGRALRHDVYGVVLPYERYFEDQEAFRAACGMPPPDVIFDLLGPGQRAQLRGWGYTRVFLSEASAVRPPESIFVRRGLLGDEGGE